VIKITSGRSYPLGATCDEYGINFALFSANAHKVELCLFNETGEKEIARHTLPEFTDDIWHGHIKGLKAGTQYGYRVHGPFEPHLGHRFNPYKLSLDPYAKKLNGDFVQSELNYSYQRGSSEEDLTLDIRDNASAMPKCVAINAVEKCQSHPQIRRRDTIIYELHVKGFSQLNLKINKKIRGTFAGLASNENIHYLKSLGVTSVELLPIHQFVSEDFVTQKNLTNYWGYNSIAFFVPHHAYVSPHTSSDAIAEFKAMVETLHQANIEVILDVVFNHTAEGNQLGPSYSFKGIDNASYYRLSPENKRYYSNESGCGNTLNIEHPRVLQLVTDSLRYWVDIMGVDGFRFDLATILGRSATTFDQHNHFFSALKQDPALAKVKLIAEPWDLGEHGYQLGNFPSGWLEWNDKFRDSTRRFWRGENSIAADFAKRLHGSSDLFEKPSRRPASSINFITSHDGFTLADLVSYQAPNNHANGENNQDGHQSNFNCNFGNDGTSNNPLINSLRDRQRRNLLTTLFIAQGTPMLLAGDELSHSQQGNNNAYCQDNEISWLNWKIHNKGIDLNENNTDFLFVKKLITLRKNHPLLNRTLYQHGDNVSAKTNLPDISWFNCHGKLMSENDWHNQELKCFAMCLADTDEQEKVEQQTGADDALLMIFNAHEFEITFHLPSLKGLWKKLIDTAQPNHNSAINLTDSTLTYTLTIQAHSCVMLSFSQIPLKQTSMIKINQTSNIVKSNHT